MFEEPNWDTDEAIGKMVDTIFSKTVLSKKVLKKTLKTPNVPSMKPSNINEDSTENNLKKTVQNQKSKSKNKYKHMVGIQNGTTPNDSKCKMQLNVDSKMPLVDMNIGGSPSSPKLSIRKDLQEANPDSKLKNVKKRKMEDVNLSCSSMKKRKTDVSLTPCFDNESRSVIKSVKKKTKLVGREKSSMGDEFHKKKNRLVGSLIGECAEKKLSNPKEAAMEIDPSFPKNSTPVLKTDHIKGTSKKDKKVTTKSDEPKTRHETNNLQNILNSLDAQKLQQVNKKDQKKKLKKNKKNFDKPEVGSDSDDSLRHSFQRSSNEKKDQETANPSVKNPVNLAGKFNIQQLRQVLKKGQQANLKKNKKTSLNVNEPEDESNSDEPSNQPPARLSNNKRKQMMASLSLKERMLAQLNSARFRYLNESFYTTSSEEALKLFQEDDDAFKIYHEGFSNQVSKWPVNPVDLMISYIENKKLSNLVIADLGCGDAKIARTIKNKVVHSFDLVALNKHVTACDMNKVPLKTSSVDIAVCCLSLMGTNFIKSLIEASRILKNNGTFLIAEVVSRFDSVQSFVRAMDKMGFLLIKKDESNKMFLWFEFRKVGKVPPVGKMPKIELAPCLYKRR